MSDRYLLAGNRDIHPPADAERKDKPDGYSEFWRGGRVVALYRTEFLA